MRIYLMRETRKTMGALLYYEKSRTAVIELIEELDEWTAPLLFTKFVKEGVFTIPREISWMWVKERVIPSSRQNIGMILKNHNLKEYDEMKLLELSSGKCCQDDFYVVRTKSMPEFVLERQRRNLVECIACQDKTLLCFFADGSARRIHLEDMDHHVTEIVLGNEQLFRSCGVTAGGYSVSFNNSIDISARDLYEMGIAVPVKLSDFVEYVQSNLLDTTEASDYLECSRQNLGYLVKRNQLNPVKTDVKGSLYSKNSLSIMN